MIHGVDNCWHIIKWRIAVGANYMPEGCPSPTNQFRTLPSYSKRI